MSEKTLNEQYLEKINALVERAQESGEVSNTFTYSHSDKTWVLTLPRSVMEQKRLVHVRNEYFAKGSFEAEKQMLEMMCANAMCNGKPVRLEMLEYGDLEVLKLAYLDGLLLPLSLGGEKSLLTYMEAAVENL